MAEILTDEQIARIEARLNAATPGPWTIVRYGDGDSLVLHSDSDNRVCFMATPGSHGDPAKIAADARLIARAREDIPALIATVRALKAECETLRELETLRVLENERAARERAKRETTMTKLDAILPDARIAEIEEFMKHVGDHPYCKRFVEELIINRRAQAERIGQLEAERNEWKAEAQRLASWYITCRPRAAGVRDVRRSGLGSG